MRVAVVQFAPKIGRVQENIDTALKLCDRLRPDTVDLVCLPEMIFTGYVFPDAASISPYLEEPRTGPTSRFCASLAARLRCYVVAGYPERLPPHEVHKAQIQLDDGSGSGTSTKEIEQVGANAAVLYGPDGEFVGDYRKTNLYTTDMTWARAGTGFVTFHLPPPLNVVSLAICMDLNVQPPAVWNSLRGPYEVAEYCIAQKTNLLVLLNAWLDSQGTPREDTDWQTINFWATRLRPLWAEVVREDAHADANAEDEADSDAEAEDEAEDGADRHTSRAEEGRQPGEELVVVVCNRCGVENGITFAGSSSLFSLTRGAGRPKLLHCMGRREEGLAVWTYPSENVQNGTASP